MHQIQQMQLLEMASICIVGLARGGGALASCAPPGSALELSSRDLCVYGTHLGHHYSFNNSISLYPGPLRFGRDIVNEYSKKSINQFFEVYIRQAS